MRPRTIVRTTGLPEQEADGNGAPQLQYSAVQQGEGELTQAWCKVVCEAKHKQLPLIQACTTALCSPLQG